MPVNDNALYLQCHAGNLGSFFWVRVPAGVDPAVFARSTFSAARLDTPLFRSRLKLSGTFVGGFSIINWGYREWVPYPNAPNRGRWRLIVKLGEVNERNAGRPPGGFTYQHTTTTPPPNPAPILTRRCARHWNLDRDPIRYGNVFIRIQCPDGFVADKFYLSGVTTFFGVNDTSDGSAPDVSFLTTSSILGYPIPATSFASSGKSYPETNPLIGNYQTPQPATFPIESAGVFTFDEPVLIYPYLTNPDGTDNRLRNPLYKFDPNVLPGQELPQEGYYSHYNLTETVAAGWFGFGNLSRVQNVPKYAGYPVQLVYSISLHYTKVPPGYRLGWGKTAGFIEKRCDNIPKPAPEPDTVCVAGMDIQGGCLVVTACDGDTASTYKLCLQGDGLIPQLRFSEGSKAAKGTVNVSVNLFGGGGINATFTDESGYRYPLLGD